MSGYLKPGYFNTERLFIPTEWGLITEGILDFWGMIDFERNRLYKLSSEKAAAISTYKIKNRSGFFLITDSILHCYDPEKDSVNKITINKNDFIETGLTLYKEDKKELWGYVFELKYYALISLIFIIILIYAVRNKRINAEPVHLSSETKPIIPTNEKPSFFGEVLSEQEKSVYEKITENTLQDKFTTIDEINHVLGVKNKDNTIQNKLRSDCLQMINKKFMVFATTNDVLIERERTSFDKRVYQYSINKRYLKKLK